MCGINGILRLSPGATQIDRNELLVTREAMAARGPDGSGEWWSDDRRIALAHRRLAIIDLSDGGAQPMSTADGRFHIVYNGEIYNYRELRANLATDGYTFRSKSDTEVLLALWRREGVGMFCRLRGMYSLAIWDEAEKRLVLARDPYGIKPLYYSVIGDVLRFASQVKALEGGGAISLEIDPGALVGFLSWGSIPEPFTLRKSIRILPAGHFLDVRDGQLEDPTPHSDLWTSHPDPARTSMPASPKSDPTAAARAAIEESIVAHLVADVPVAVFLSAGLDAAMVAAVATRHLPEPPTTFTLAFDELEGTPHDEALGARQIAEALGTRHIERRLSREDLDSLFASSLEAMDQPSIDGFNTFLVSRVAAEAGLKVVLSGLGGDEIFGSYPSFKQVPRWARWARRGRRVPVLQALWPAIARRVRSAQPKLAGLLRYGEDLPGAYFLRRGLFLPDEIRRILGDELTVEGFSRYEPLASLSRMIEEKDQDRGEDDSWIAIHRLESSQYMRNQLLRDSDWASMASSLELRVPFVDKELSADLAALNFEPARSEGKAVLARAVASELPSSLFSRPKSGFFVPLPPRLVRTKAGAGTAPSSQTARDLALRALTHFGIELEDKGVSSAAHITGKRDGANANIAREKGAA